MLVICNFWCLDIIRKVAEVEAQLLTHRQLPAAVLYSVPVLLKAFWIVYCGPLDRLSTYRVLCGTNTIIIFFSDVNWLLNRQLVDYVARGPMYVH